MLKVFYMKKISELRVLLVADSHKVMLKDSFKSGLYPEIVKIFDSLFGSTKICFGDKTNVFDNKNLSDLKQSLVKSEFKHRLINKLLHFIQIFLGRNLYFEKYFSYTSKYFSYLELKFFDFLNISLRDLLIFNISYIL